MNGKNKEILRKQFETQIGKKPLTNKGIKTKNYQDWLKKNCTPHWMTEATELFKFEPQLTAGDITFAEAKQKQKGRLCKSNYSSLNLN